MSISVKILVKNYAIADFANAKNAKKFLHKHEKQHKNTRTRSRAENGRNQQKNGRKTEKTRRQPAEQMTSK